MKFSEERSKELASLIEMAQIYLRQIDEDYLIAISQQFSEQAGKQDAASVLNPVYDFNKSELLREQSEAMKALHEFITHLKRCDELKRMIARRELAAGEIDKLFI